VSRRSGPKSSSPTYDARRWSQHLPRWGSEAVIGDRRGLVVLIARGLTGYRTASPWRHRETRPIASMAAVEGAIAGVVSGRGQRSISPLQSEPLLRVLRASILDSEGHRALRRGLSRRRVVVGIQVSDVSWPRRVFPRGAAGPSRMRAGRSEAGSIGELTAGSGSGPGHCAVDLSEPTRHTGRRPLLTVRPRSNRWTRFGWFGGGGRLASARPAVGGRPCHDIGRAMPFGGYLADRPRRDSPLARTSQPDGPRGRGGPGPPPRRGRAGPTIPRERLAATPRSGIRHSGRPTGPPARADHGGRLPCARAGP
jgi:hypothetical protein